MKTEIRKEWDRLRKELQITHDNVNILEKELNKAEQQHEIANHNYVTFIKKFKKELTK